MARILSYTEINTASTCEARWDFKYGGHLLDGETIKLRRTSARLSGGRAWGAAVAAWHAAQGQLDGFGSQLAHVALGESLARDIEEMHDRGIKVPLDLAREQEDDMHRLLDHHMQTTKPLPNLTALEGEFITPIPSRTGKQASTRYRFQSFIDGYTVDANGHQWIVEFKLRGQLHPAWLIPTLRQYLWYVWSVAKAQGYAPVGILVDERLNAMPRAPKINKPTKKWPNGIVSNDKRLKILPADYLAACARTLDVDGNPQQPDPDMLKALEDVRYHHRIPVQFDADEILEGGRELTSAALRIGELDTGRRFPLRNTSPMTCGGCDFKDVCPHPREAGYVLDQTFVRSTPKRLRAAKPETAAGGRPPQAKVGPCTTPPPSQDTNVNPYEAAAQEAAY